MSLTVEFGIVGPGFVLRHYGLRVLYDNKEHIVSLDNYIVFKEGRNYVFQAGI
jgi:hypothetical protein